MSERQKQHMFLKTLLQRDNSEHCHQLQERIVKAERDETCVFSAMHWVAFLGLISLCGLCYEAVFVEDFFNNPTHWLTRLLGYLACGSAIGWLTFLAYWLWCRALTNRLFADCRRMLITPQASPAKITPASECPIMVQMHVQGQDTAALPSFQADPVSKAA